MDCRRTPEPLAAPSVPFDGAERPVALHNFIPHERIPPRDRTWQELSANRPLHISARWQPGFTTSRRCGYSSNESVSTSGRGRHRKGIAAPHDATRSPRRRTRARCTSVRTRRSLHGEFYSETLLGLSVEPEKPGRASSTSAGTSENSCTWRTSFSSDRRVDGTT